MIDCPDCDKPLHGKSKCACGYVVKEQPLYQGEHSQVTAEQLASPPPVVERKPGSSWRERWFAEKKLPYEPPRIGINCPPFRRLEF